MRLTKPSGFTLIELMLAMAFVGILLVTMTVSVINITNLYSKGISIKSINQAGRDLGAAIKRDSSSIAPIATPLVQPDSGGGLGRFCLGSYSYIWNKPDALLNGEAINYSDASTPIVLARVPDSGGALCVSSAGTYPMLVSKVNAVEMLPSQNGDYALHNLELSRMSSSTGSEIYDIHYTIGTNDQASIDTIDQSCKVDNSGGQKFDYCSINTFELIVRVG